jgi:hypothetical protein
VTAPQASPLGVARIIWLALLAAVVAYVVVLAALAGRGGPAVDVAPAVRTALQGLALAHVVAVIVLRGRLVPLGAAPPTALGAWVVCWALAEAIALFGLVLGMLERSLADAPPFLLTSAALLLWLRPRA